MSAQHHFFPYTMYSIYTQSLLVLLLMAGYFTLQPLEGKEGEKSFCISQVLSKYSTLLQDVTYLGQCPKDSLYFIARDGQLYIERNSASVYFSVSAFILLLSLSKFIHILIPFRLGRYLPFCTADTFSRIHLHGLWLEVIARIQTADHAFFYKPAGTIQDSEK